MCFTLTNNTGDLASITNKETNEFLSKIATTSVWVGGYRLVNDLKTFGWSDGSYWHYKNWRKKGHEPNNPFKERCVEMERNGEWSDQKCSFKRSYLCQVKPQESVC